MPSFVWNTHRQEDDLWFRAACNAAAPPAARPVKGRVLHRLAEDKETRAVWSSVAGDSGSESAPVYFAKLVADVRWQTLVTERVESERCWSDLRGGLYRDAWDRLGAFLEKLLGGPGHPLTHAMTLVAAGVTSFLLAMKLVSTVTGPMDLPIRAQLAAVQLKLDPGMEPVRVNLTPDGLVAFKAADDRPLEIGVDRVEDPLCGRPGARQRVRRTGEPGTTAEALTPGAAATSGR